MHSGRNFDALVGMDSLSKAAFHRTLLRHPRYTQVYLDHAYNIVHDIRKCDMRVLHEIDPKEGGAVQDDEEKKDGKPDLIEKPVEIRSPDSIKTDSPSNKMVTGFPPSPDEMVYVEDDCLKYVHASGPLDIGCDFEAFNELVRSNLTRSSFQYTEYFDLIHDFLIFFDKWLTVNTVQFYQCWVSWSIGSYPKNIFLLPLDYYQADVEDIFEDYWNRIEPFVKKKFGMRMWRYVHPASHLRHKINIGKKKSGVSYPHTDLSPAAPWNFDIFKRKITCFTAKNVLHYGFFAALNASNLIHGDNTNKQECGLVSFDSGGSRQSPLPRTVAFLEYTYFLLNICHAIHSLVVEQDEADTYSDAVPDFESMFDVCRAETKSQKGGFFNVGNMRPERIPSATYQSDGCNCGVYTCLSWSMFVAVERNNPGLWTKIETLADLDKEIVKPFWDLHENKEVYLINFRYRICRLMEFFLDKRLVKKQRSMIAVGGHPLPDNWVYSKKLHANLRLPPCAGGPIPTAYAREKACSVAVVKMVDANAGVEESDEVKKERNNMQEYLILSFVDCTGISKKTLNYTIRRSRAGRSKKRKLCLKIIRGVNQTSKPHGRPTRSVYRTTFRKTSLQQTMVFVMNVPRWRRKILCACTAVPAFTLCLTVADSMAIS
jgi:hypothetical protein